MKINPSNILASPDLWQPPPIHFLRLDVAACLSDCSEFCGVGGVIRNHDGNLVAAFGRILPRTDSMLLKNY